MKVRLAGELSNVQEAVREVRQIYPDAPASGSGGAEISDSMRSFMVDLLRDGSSRALFLWLLKVTFDITAPAEWWHQGGDYFCEIRWVRKHPREEGASSLLTQDDFEGGVPTMLLDTLNEFIETEQRELLEATLPENYVRRGYAQSDYAALRRLYLERGHYNAGHWHDLAQFLTTLPYAEFITT
jgi:hypothetical protein